MRNISDLIVNGHAVLGVELGSTRIKAALIDERYNVIASGSHEWSNKLADGYWSYSLEDIRAGLQESFAELNGEVLKRYGVKLTKLKAIGISAMMHGYLAFDSDWKLLTPFRTWRNTNTAQAADKLSELLDFNMPMRWSVSHLYQAILNGEKHVDKVAHLTTLAGYIHYLLTGENVLGIGDASGMFPCSDAGFDQARINKCNGLFAQHGLNVDLNKILPTVLLAGQHAGTLTAQGAKYLDPTGALQAGAVMCPPEGDAGTGMVATNSVKLRSANVSAGTSAFLMAVMERPLSRRYKEIDVVATPDGSPVAMVHVNNCTSEINEWVSLFNEVITLFGGNISKDKLFTRLFNKSVESDADVGKLIGYNFLSGEPIAEVENGRPLFARLPDGKLNLANFMQAQIYSALGTLAMGMEILHGERVAIDGVCGHGGFFKTEFIGQNAMSAAVNAPVTVMNNAGEGGAWGMAILALYSLNSEISLSEFLDKVFANASKVTVTASKEEKQKFTNFINLYKQGLIIAKAASEVK